MPNGFFKCQEGIDAYSAIGKEYDDTLDDTRYDHILKVTANSPHSARNRNVVRVMIRELADDGNQYIKYDIQETKYDAIGAYHGTYKPNVGTYPIPRTQPKIEFGADMTTKDIVNGPIIDIETGYLIPFTKEAADKIHAMADDASQRHRTQYTIKRTGGRRVACQNYLAWRDRTFEELEIGTSQEVEKPRIKSK